MSRYRIRRGRGRPPYPDVLTPAEWRVLEHVRLGRTNPEIAEALGVTVDTAKAHVSNMLGKLGLVSRQELAEWDGQVADDVRPHRRALGFGALWGRVSAAGSSVGGATVGAAMLSVAAVAVAGLVVASRGRDAASPPQPVPAEVVKATSEPTPSPIATEVPPTVGPSRLRTPQPQRTPAPGVGGLLVVIAPAGFPAPDLPRWQTWDGRRPRVRVVHDQASAKGIPPSEIGVIAIENGMIDKVDWRWVARLFRQGKAVAGLNIGMGRLIGALPRPNGFAANSGWPPGSADEPWTAGHRFYSVLVGRGCQSGDTGRYDAAAHDGFVTSVFAISGACPGAAVAFD